MRRPVVILVALLPAASAALAQHPLGHATDAVEIRYALSQPVVRYTLRVDSAV